MRLTDLPAIELHPAITPISAPPDPLVPPKKLVIIMAEFNEAITRRLANGAAAAARDLKVERVELWTVPGALEIPVLLQSLAATNDWNGVRSPLIVTAACVIQGDTDHYHHVCTQSITGVQHIAVARALPLGNAILTLRTLEQAMERAGDGPTNKGFEAAQAAAQLHRLFRKSAA
jgi:6,7-dimethyl-8-ribityllumazine synthase